MNLKGWRTLLANIASVAAIAVQDQTVMNIFSKQHQAEILSTEVIVLAIINVVLRLNTNTPAGQGAPPAGA